MACDPFWNKTVLACHFDGTNGSTTFTDEKGHTLTPAGNAQISTAQSKFGGASLYVNGGGLIVSDPNSDADLSSADWVIDAFIFPTALSGYQTIASRRSAVWEIGLSGATPYFWAGSAVYTASGSVQQDVWTHLAVVRQSGVVTFYINGVAAGSVTAGAGGAASSLYIGYAGSGQVFSGYIDDLRITKAARYTANFTPDTAAFLTNQCTISGTVKDATGAFAAKTVRAFRRDTGALVGTTVSNATTGAYSIDTADGEHFVVAYDSSANPPSGGTENAVILDRLVPV